MRPLDSLISSTYRASRNIRECVSLHSSLAAEIPSVLSHNVCTDTIGSDKDSCSHSLPVMCVINVNGNGSLMSRIDELGRTGSIQFTTTSSASSGASSVRKTGGANVHFAAPI